MGKERRFSTQGKRFLVMVLYFGERARRTGKKARLGKVPFTEGELARLQVRVKVL